MNQYCPAQFVRRDQMAAFMNRLGNVTFQQGGNAFGATGVLGTTDDHPLDVRVNDTRVARYEPNAISPNVIGGHPDNTAAENVRGATIAGGGVAAGDSEPPPFINEGPSRVTDVYGSVLGGNNNRAGNDTGTIVDAAFATVGGGAVTSWRYIDNATRTRHVGPTVQDFGTAFGLGSDARTIGMVDADGIALAAIQGLNAKLESKVADQARELAAQRAELVEIKRAVAGLLAATR